MSLPKFSMRQLIECGVHYGHQSHRWNPLMGEFIHSKRNRIHIIDLTKTIPMLDAALHAVFETISKGGSVLFVGTKRQAQKPVAEAAGRCAQFYINQRWLGGTLTNWHTVSNSIGRLKSIDEKLESGIEGLTKRELLGMRREQGKLQASLGGIRDMKSLPDMLFVVDVKKEALAVAEAKKLGIPVVAVVDTNCSPDGVTFLVPGNDDASRAINLYCDLFAQAALGGLQLEMSAKGVDPGKSVAVDEAGPPDSSQDSEVAEAPESGTEYATDESVRADATEADATEADAIEADAIEADAAEKIQSKKDEKPTEETAVSTGNEDASVNEGIPEAKEGDGDQAAEPEANGSKVSSKPTKSKSKAKSKE